jgi:hypothetical protein
MVIIGPRSVEHILYPKIARPLVELNPGSSRIVLPTDLMEISINAVSRSGYVLCTYSITKLRFLRLYNLR